MKSTKTVAILFSASVLLFIVGIVLSVIYILVPYIRFSTSNEAGEILGNMILFILGFGIGLPFLFLGLIFGIVTLILLIKCIRRDKALKQAKDYEL